MRSRTSMKITAAALAATLSLTAASCGSDKDSSSSTTETTVATTVKSDSKSTIVSVASGNEDFSTLVAAVKAAGLVDTLSGEGPFTVFAPTNEAFDALPEGTVDGLLEPANKEKLADILKYHVVSGKVMAADLSDGQKIDTVQGGTLTVGIEGDKVTLTDESGATVNIVKADVDAGNGVIHAIDGVLTPKADAATGEAGSDEAAAGTIVDVASANPDFSTLVTAVKAADLATTLAGEGPFTVFAPTNEAFDALPAGTLDTLVKPENKEKLASILTYHVVAAKVMAADLTDGQKVDTVNGDTLTVGVEGDKVTLTDSSGNTVNVVKADVAASNGVIHAIDAVLMPKG